MSKYGDLVALLEWADRKKEKPTRTTPAKPDKPVDVLQLIQAKRQEAQLLENYLKEMEKINKKEEKKPEGFFQKFTIQQLTMMLLLIPPYVLILQQVLLKH